MYIYIDMYIYIHIYIHDHHFHIIFPGFGNFMISELHDLRGPPFQLSFGLRKA